MSYDLKLNHKEIKEIVDLLIATGRENNIAPMAFFLAMIKTAKIIADTEKFDVNQMWLLFQDNEKSIHYH